MLIVSQSRETVVNFNNCVKVGLGKYSVKNWWSVDAYTTTDTIVINDLSSSHSFIAFASLS